MKRFSLKTRLVLLHTGMMTLVVCGVLAVLFSAGFREILTNVRGTLETRVTRAMEYIAYTQDRLEFDSDLLALDNGVYLSVYEPDDQTLLYGRLPYGFAYDLPFSEGELRTVSAGGTEYCVLDVRVPIQGYHELILRGVISVSDAERDFRYTLRLALILSPVLVLLTAVCGYLLSRRALRPVAQITRTVQEIRADQDLSRRIQLGDGRDEIYTLAQTFDTLLDAVEAGVRREKQFTSDVAHELRTPLTVVLMQCEELLSEETLAPETRLSVETIHRKVRAMAEMVSQLLLLSRADQGQEKLCMENLDFSELSQMEAETFSEIAAQRDIQLEADIEPDIHLYGDQTLLLRLWNNLLQNAVTYGRAGGHIWMTVHADSDAVQLQVRDDGIGIAPEHLPHIWERFYQVSPSRSAESSGLGLSMVRWIVQAHDGDITVESTEGAGTVFTVQLPLASADKREQ